MFCLAVDVACQPRDSARSNLSGARRTRLSGNDRAVSLGVVHLQDMQYPRFRAATTIIFSGIASVMQCQRAGCALSRDQATLLPVKAFGQLRWKISLPQSFGKV